MLTAQSRPTGRLFSFRGCPVPVSKPPSVASDPFKSAQWDELTAGRDFSQADAPTLELLCQWYAVVKTCIDDIDAVGQVAYTNDMGDLRALPQISTMKQASAEIRQLAKQLGIADGGRGEAVSGGGDNVLRLVAGKRQERRARAAN